MGFVPRSGNGPSAVRSGSFKVRHGCMRLLQVTRSPKEKKSLCISDTLSNLVFTTTKQNNISMYIRSNKKENSIVYIVRASLKSNPRVKQT